MYFIFCCCKPVECPSIGCQTDKQLFNSLKAALYWDVFNCVMFCCVFIKLEASQNMNIFINKIEKYKESVHLLGAAELLFLLQQT